MLLKGVLALFLGAAAFLLPNLTLVTLAFVWGFYALVDGGLWLALAIGRRGIGMGYRIWLVIIGLGGMAAGLLVLLAPQYALPLLALYIGLWAFAVGVLQLIGAVFVRRRMAGAGRLMAAGLLGVLLGVLLVARPAVGVLALAWTIGAYAVLIGLDYVSLALRMRLERHRSLGGGARAGPSSHAA